MSVTVPSAPASALLIGEAVLDVDEQEREDGEVEPVERPAEERREKCPPLCRIDLAIPGSAVNRRDRSRQRLWNGVAHRTLLEAVPSGAR